MNEDSSNEYLKTFGYPYDVRSEVRKVENTCPVGYVKGDYIEYNHMKKSLGGPKGVCLHSLIHSGVLASMEMMRGRGSHSIYPEDTPGWVRADGKKPFGKICQCQGPEGPTVFWETVRIKNLDRR